MLSYINLFVLSILLFMLLDKGDAVLCYSCNSLYDGNCEDPFNETLYEPVECGNNNFICIKQTKFDIDENSTYLHRGCIQKHSCEVFAKASDFCATCTLDLCNSSLEVLNSPILLVFIVTISYCLFTI